VNTPAYDKDITALLVVDPYNDFISECGKIWLRIKAVAEANNCVAHMLEVLNAARRAKLRVFYAMHHRYRPGDYETWKYIAPIQKGAWQHRSFEFGTWGGEFRAESVPAPGEIVAQEHWCSSGFANTDLDLQLKKHGIDQLIIIGLIAHTCIEATVRYAAELGYQVTVVKDATADYSDEMMHAALDINMPNYASAVVTAKEVDSISSLSLKADIHGLITLLRVITEHFAVSAAWEWRAPQHHRTIRKQTDAAENRAIRNRRPQRPAPQLPRRKHQS
jgi:nicotinamidase-related amidase